MRKLIVLAVAASTLSLAACGTATHHAATVADNGNPPATATTSTGIASSPAPSTDPANPKLTPSKTEADPSTPYKQRACADVGTGYWPECDPHGQPCPAGWSKGGPMCFNTNVAGGDTTPAPKAHPRPEAQPAAAQPTAGQSNALESAQEYLTDGQGFSESGLMGQLTSSSGEGFSHADAAWAIAHANADWNQQAVDSAKSYMSDGEGFSRSGLMDQLTSSYGEGFTQAQASYALDKVYH